MLRTSLLFALVSIPALAAPQVSDHERALQKASKWSDVTAQLKGRLPSNVVKEFADFAKNEEFPTSRRIKNKLVITESDGTKVTIEYKKDGAISLNGKEWRLRPLATVEEEITRLALFINGEKKAEASLFGLVPAAQAGGAAVGGAAIAAFAGANAWKAESCGEKEIQGDLVNDCPLMAVKMQPILVTARKIDDPDLYLPVSLKCPAENKGTLELITKNIRGDSERIRITYKEQLPKVVALAVAEKDASFDEWFNVDLTQSSDDRKVRMANQAASKVDSLRKDVCNGSKQSRQRYLSSLNANRADLSQSASYQAPDDKTSMEAL